MHDLAENIKFDYEYAGGTLNGSATTAVYIPMTNYDKIAFIIYTGTLTSSASLVFQGMQRLGSGGAAKVLGAASSAYTTDDGITVVEFNAADMDVSGGYDRIGLIATEGASQNAVIHSIVAARFNTRFAQASLLS